MAKFLTTTAATAALIAGTAAPVFAELKYENASGGFVLLYGQASPAFLSVDDGFRTYDDFTDNSHSNTRVGLKAEQPMSGGTFRFHFETGLGFATTANLSQDTDPDTLNWQRTSLRFVDFSYEGDTWGRLSIGQGSMATDGAADQTLNGVFMVQYNGVPDFAGSYQFRDGAGTLSGIAIGDVTSSLDGGRKGRIRYDTPTFNGFTVSVAAGTEILADNNDDDFYDIALRHSMDTGTAQINSAIGFSRKESSGVDTDDVMGSVSVLLDSGLNFTVAAGSRDSSGSYVYGGVGYTADWTSLGSTSIGVDYYSGSDFVSDGSDSAAYGIGIQQVVDSINTEFYLGYRNHELSEIGTDYEDVRDRKSVV